RSAQAASIGVWYRAGPPFEAAPFSGKPFVFQEIGRFLGKIPGRPRTVRHVLSVPRIAAESLDSAEIAARTIRVAVAPLFHQCLKLGIVPIGQNNSGGDKQVSGSPRLGQTLALEAENAPAGGVFWNRQLHRAAERRHSNLAAQHRLI